METEAIRTVVLCGSRADPARHPDAYSDYDIEVFVTSTAPFLSDGGWITRFGDVLVRWPLNPRPTGRDDTITQLVQYTDGARIDFQITDAEPARGESVREPYRVLVDKDGLVSTLPPVPAARTVSKPTEEELTDRANAFWWDSIYVARALCRDELNYARYMLDSMLRFSMVGPMLEWYVGCTRGWDTNVGIHGRWFRRHLSPEVWALYLRTFADADSEANWRALFAMVDLVQLIGLAVAENLGYGFDSETGRAVGRFIQSMRHDRT